MSLKSEDVNTSEYLKTFEPSGLLNNSVCWWCTHTIDSLPVGAPTHYNHRMDTFKVHGAFCSFECAKAYLIDRNNSYVDTSLITLLNKRLTGKINRINCAPPRIALAKFGGTMTIEEFRSKSQMQGIHFITSIQKIKHEQLCVSEQGNVVLPPPVYDESNEKHEDPSVASTPRMINEHANRSHRSHINCNMPKPKTTKVDAWSLESCMNLTIK